MTSTASAAARTSARPSAAASRRARMVEENMPLVRHIANRMARRAAPYLEVDDLISIGTEALMHATDRYDEDRSVSFGSFAYLRVRGAMIEGLGQAGPNSRGRLRKRKDRPGAGAAAMRFCPYDDARRNDVGGDELADWLAGAIDLGRLGPVVREAMADLDEVDRAFIERHYFGGEQLLEIGRDHGVSKSWASRIHARALARLREAVEARLAGQRGTSVG